LQSGEQLVGEGDGVCVGRQGIAIFRAQSAERVADQVRQPAEVKAVSSKWVSYDLAARGVGARIGVGLLPTRLDERQQDTDAVRRRMPLEQPQAHQQLSQILAEARHAGDEPAGIGELGNRGEGFTREFQDSCDCRK
jgi:hypothetical protein